MSIKTHYVSLETAKILNSRGYDEPCRGRYTVKKWNTAFKVGELFLSDFPLVPDAVVYAPEQWMVVEWLFQRWGIWISVAFDSWNSGKFFYDIAQQGDKEYHYDSIIHFDTSQESYEHAILYCLNNLVPKPL